MKALNETEIMNLTSLVIVALLYVGVASYLVSLAVSALMVGLTLIGLTVGVYALDRFAQFSAVIAVEEGVIC